MRPRAHWPQRAQIGHVLKYPSTPDVQCTRRVQRAYQIELILGLTTLGLSLSPYIIIVIYIITYYINIYN